MHVRPGAAPRVLIATVVVVLAGILVSWIAIAALASAPTSQLEGSLFQYTQLRCVQEQMEATVPAGAPIRIMSTDDMRRADENLAPVIASYWFQRLTELAYPRFDLVASTETVTAVVGITPLGSGGCDGVGVRIVEP